MGSGRPRRLSEIAAILAPHGVELLYPSGSSHFKLVRPGYRPMIVTAHNGVRSEIPWVYIKKICSGLGLPISLFE
jgi:hypothetical protein